MTFPTIRCTTAITRVLGAPIAPGLCCREKISGQADGQGRARRNAVCTHLVPRHLPSWCSLRRSQETTRFRCSAVVVIFASLEGRFSAIPAVSLKYFESRVKRFSTGTHPSVIIQRTMDFDQLVTFMEVAK